MNRSNQQMLFYKLLCSINNKIYSVLSTLLPMYNFISDEVISRKNKDENFHILKSKTIYHGNSMLPHYTKFTGVFCTWNVYFGVVAPSMCMKRYVSNLISIYFSKLCLAFQTEKTYRGAMQIRSYI